MSAETVVGPSIASGSHTCKGNCPLLPTAPPKKSSVIMVNWAGGMCSIAANIVWNCRRYAPSGTVKSLMFR
ncbi:MAG: hypothetical protein KBONHNOK_00684 [Candidatus Methanoperedenaceae archaeon GB50]|nr:MAG: hypothetical protein KBONHNOK_00684 [Candidatus Methanoperedenaceae archaeon GB50]